MQGPSRLESLYASSGTHKGDANCWTLHILLKLGDNPVIENEELGYIGKVRLFNADAKLFIAFNATRAFSWSMGGVIFNLYMVEAGFEADFLGVFLAVAMFATAGVSIIAGLFTDRRSRKNIILVSTVVSFFAIAFQYAVLDASWLLISQALLGFSSAFIMVAWSPYVTGLSTSKERAHLFGFSSGIALLAVFAGSVLGGYLPHILMELQGVAPTLFWAYRKTLWLSLLPLAVSTLMVVPMTRDRPTGVTRSFGVSHINNSRFIAKYAATITVVGMGAGIIVMYFNLFFSWWGADSALIGIIFGFNILVLSAGNFLAPAMADRIGKVKTVVITEALSIPFLLMLYWSPFFSLAVLAYIARSTLMNMAGPISNTLFMEGLTKEERSTAVGVVGTGDQFVRGVGAIIGGWFLAAGLYKEPYLLVSGLYVLAVVMFYYFFKNKEQEIEAVAKVKVTLAEETKATSDII
jgi:MFS family permease